jgi:transposase
VAVEPPCGCPDCGGELEEAGTEEQVAGGDPGAAPDPAALRDPCRALRWCGQRVRGRHPLQTSQATGAAAAHVGREAISLAARLHCELGLSMGKAAAVLHEICGITITRGGSPRRWPAWVSAPRPAT